MWASAAVQFESVAAVVAKWGPKGDEGANTASNSTACMQLPFLLAGLACVIRRRLLFTGTIILFSNFGYFCKLLILADWRTINNSSIDKIKSL